MLSKLKHILSNKLVVVILLITLLLFSSWTKLFVYLNISWSLNIMWIVLLPFIIYIKERGQYSYRYGILTVLMLMVYAFVQAPIFFFFSFCFALFFIIEIWIGKVNALAPLVILTVTPFTKYVFDLFGFPIRLFLSDVATQVLSFIGYDVSTQGNVMTLNGESFSVDAACMGLRLVITSFLITFMLISHFEKKSGKEIRITSTLITLFLAFILVIIANLFRIVLLIVFNSPPETLSHELIGIGCIVAVVIIPMYHIVKLFSSKFIIRNTPKTNINKSSFLKIAFTAVIACAISLLGFIPANYSDIPKDQAIEKLSINNYSKEILPNNIGKFISNNHLLYIKPSKGFYRSDHNPFICWRGSGYEIKNEKIIELHGKEIQFAHLVSPSTTLYTAWWYDNGTHQSINQIDWRWRSAKGEKPFRLFNLTASTPTQLLNEAAKFLKTPPIIN
jgi:exosortase N